MRCIMQIGKLVQEGAITIKTGPFGTQLKAAEYQETGIPVLNVKNLGYGTVNSAKLDHVGADTVERLRIHLLQQGDIVFGRKGAVDRHAYIDNESDGWMQGSDCIRLRVETDDINPRFLSYYFLTNQHKAFMISMCSHGTTMASLNQKILEQIDFPCLERNYQDKIVEILSKIDEKGRVNQKINENLLQQARALFRKWFSITSSGLYKLSDIADINPETYSPKENWSFVNYLDTSNITSGTINEVQYIIPSEEKLPSRARRILRKDDVVFSTVRPNQLHYGIISNPKPNMLGSTGFAVIRSKYETMPNEIIYLALTESAFVEQMQQLAEQSVSTFPSIRPADLDACVLPEPKEDDNNFMETIKSIFNAVAINNEENQRLATLRDTLLPRLMSGELDVSRLDF